MPQATTTRRSFLATAFRLGRQNQLLPVAAAIQEKGAVVLAPTPAMRSIAPAFAQALLLVRQADSAERWRDMLDMKSDADKLLAASLAVQLYLVAPNPGRAGRAQDALSVLAANTLTPQPVGGFEAKEFAALALGLYDALGETMPADAHAQLANLVQHQLPGRRLPPVAAKHLADMKGQSGQKGEAILTILDGVGAPVRSRRSRARSDGVVRAQPEGLGRRRGRARFRHRRGRALSSAAATVVTAKRKAAHSIEAFLDMMSAERGASRNTLEAYKRDLVAFEESVGDLKSATRDDIKRYLVKQARSGAAATSQARRLSSLRQYFAFLYSEGQRSDDPTLAVEGYRPRDALPKILSVDDVEKLIAAARVQAQASSGGQTAFFVSCEIFLCSAVCLRDGLELAALPLAPTGHCWRSRTISFS